MNVARQSLLGLLALVSICVPVMAVQDLAAMQQGRPKTAKLRRSSAQDRRVFGINADELIAIVDPITTQVRPSIVSIKRGRRQLALGLIVSSDGHILTKHSLLQTNFQVDTGSEILPAALVGMHRATDLAMIKIEASDLTAAEFSTTKIEAGSWLVSPGAQKKESVVGVAAMSGPFPRKKWKPFLGIQMSTEIKEPGSPQGVKISRVVANTRADRADLKINDIIQNINGHPIETTEELIHLLESVAPGQSISLDVLRNGNKNVFRLWPDPTEFKQFDGAFAHNTRLKDTQCGGPILNLDGEVLGINIFAPKRTPVAPSPNPIETQSTPSISLAIPTDTFLPILERLSSGELAPERVNAEEIELANGKIVDLETQLSKITLAQKEADSQDQVALRREQRTLHKKLRQRIKQREKLVRGF